MIIVGLPFRHGENDAVSTIELTLMRLRDLNLLEAASCILNKEGENLNLCTKKKFIIVMSVLMILVIGCTNPVKISSDQTKEFRKEIQADYSSIKQMQLEFTPTTIYIHYEMKNPVTEEEKKRFSKKVVSY